MVLVKAQVVAAYDATQAMHLSVVEHEVGGFRRSRTGGLGGPVSDILLTVRSRVRGVALESPLRHVDTSLSAQIVTLKEFHNSGWYLCENYTGRVGWVPSNCIKVRRPRPPDPTRYK